MALNENNNGKKVFSDDRTRDKIDKHLKDINDEITEQDIANVKTDVTPNIPDVDTEAELEAEKIVRDKNKKKDDEGENNNTNSVETPWNILD